MGQRRDEEGMRSDEVVSAPGGDRVRFAIRCASADELLERSAGELVTTPDGRLSDAVGVPAGGARGSESSRGGGADRWGHIHLAGSIVHPELLRAGSAHPRQSLEFDAAALRALAEGDLVRALEVGETGLAEGALVPADEVPSSGDAEAPGGFRGVTGPDAAASLWSELRSAATPAGVEGEGHTSPGREADDAIGEGLLPLESASSPTVLVDVIPVLPSMERADLSGESLDRHYRRVLEVNDRLREAVEGGVSRGVLTALRARVQRRVDELFDVLRELLAYRVRCGAKLSRRERPLEVLPLRDSARALGELALPWELGCELLGMRAILEVRDRGWAESIQAAAEMLRWPTPRTRRLVRRLLEDEVVIATGVSLFTAQRILALKPTLAAESVASIHPITAELLGDAGTWADPGAGLTMRRLYSAEARAEALELMSPARHLSPGSGEAQKPGLTSSLVLGVYQLTRMRREPERDASVFACIEHAESAHVRGDLTLQAPIRLPARAKAGATAGELFETTLGRELVCELLPPACAPVRAALDVNELSRLLDRISERGGEEARLVFLERLAPLADRALHRSGFSICMEDWKFVPNRAELQRDRERSYEGIIKQQRAGIITAGEARNILYDIGASVDKEIHRAVIQGLLERSAWRNPFSALWRSGAERDADKVVKALGALGRGQFEPYRIIDRIVNLVEGLDSVEYFLEGVMRRASHPYVEAFHYVNRVGECSEYSYDYFVRNMKHLAEATLFEKLAPVFRPLAVSMSDCGTNRGFVYEVERLPIWTDSPLVRPDAFSGRVLRADDVNRLLGRIICADVCDPQTHRLLVPRGTIIGPGEVELLVGKEASSDPGSFEPVDIGRGGGTFSVEEMLGVASIDPEPLEVEVRSPLGCEATTGVCARCLYGGVAVGETGYAAKNYGLLSLRRILAFRAHEKRVSSRRGPHDPLDACVVSPFIRAKSEGRVRFDRFDWVTDPDGRCVVTSRFARIVVDSGYGPAADEHRLPHGAVLDVHDGELIAGGQLIGSYDPFAYCDVAPVAGAVSCENMALGRNVKEVEDEKGLTVLAVVEPGPGVPPLRITVADGQGRSWCLSGIPSGAQLCVLDSWVVAAGTVLVKMPGRPEKANDFLGSHMRLGMAGGMWGAHRQREMYGDLSYLLLMITFSPVSGPLAKIGGKIVYDESSEDGIRCVIRGENGACQEEFLEVGAHRIFNDHDRVEPGALLTDSPTSLQKLFESVPRQQFLDVLYRLVRVSMADGPLLRDVELATWALERYLRRLSSEEEEREGV